MRTLFRGRVLAGEVLVGAWCSLSDAHAAEIMGSTGYDWLVVDMEHGPVPLQAALDMLMAIRTTPAFPMVRSPWKDSASIQLAMDAGACGIVIPMVNSLAEARAVVSDTRFAPLGARSRGGSRTAHAFGSDPKTYFRGGNDWTVVLVQVETVEAVQAAEQMAALEGIDGFFVGPNDLAASYDVPFPDVWADLQGPYAAAIRAIPEIARKHGKVPAILATDADMGLRCVEMGYTLVGIAVDTVLLRQRAQETLAAFRVKR